MATERPTDDLQNGENDHGTESWYKAHSEKIHRDNINKEVEMFMSGTPTSMKNDEQGLAKEVKLPTHFKFTVWWVDKSFNDVSTVIVAESEEAALSVVKEDENFNYSVRVIKGGSKFSEES